ncbi:hypothetical protein B0T26DRAFT_700101 [Lasiosphaeria miniovina]|uniref:DNA-directed RNA polymerase n=1 Tax=Lasiosphaeria miniovina TaxID=1954250 RepID=A0AA40ATH1_9PEZI|nr:uncharacterized protein B0T26DRAFT_700101 [Lasiosphaeria miniovina]KAK0721711.1 hypothetical protein B0T26DRAFT_700101 [Lasiosphaeria miniovina]
MFVRSAVSRHNLPLRRLLLSSSAQTLSTCRSPGYLRPSADATRLINTRQELRPPRRRVFDALSGLERSLATAAGAEYRPAEDISFDQLSGAIPPAYLSPQSYPAPELRGWDASSPLVVEVPPIPYEKQRINVHGVPGDPEEMLSVFDACLRVGRLERAGMVLKRFAQMEALHPDHLVELHNRFLRSRIEHIYAEPSQDKAEDVHKWFEVQIRAGDLPHTPTTVAYMLRVSLLTTRGNRLNRLLTRYMDLLPQENAMELLLDDEVLTDDELASISRICPEHDLPDTAIASPEEDIEDSTSTPVRQSPSSTEPPEVKAVFQKGLGLKSLRATLTLFSEIPIGTDIASLPAAGRREIQSRLEKDCVDAAVIRWREENAALLSMGRNTVLSNASLSARLYVWQQALEARIVEEMTKIDVAVKQEKKNTDDVERCLYGPILQQSTPTRLAAVTIISTLSSLAMFGAEKGVPLATLVTNVARVVEEDINSQRAEEANAVKRFKVLKRDAGAIIRYGKSLAPRSSETPTDALPEEFSWPISIRTKVGAILVSALIDSAKILVRKENLQADRLLTQSQPAFMHTNQIRRGKKLGIVAPNRALVELMMQEPRGDFLARQLPMVCEPEPWSKFAKGGYLEFPIPVVRVKFGERDQKVYAQAAIARGDMSQVLKGLDVLGRTAWKINRPVLDVMLEVWNSGKGLADIPPLYPNIPIPPEPDSGGDPTARNAWMKAVRFAENQKSGLHSERCFMNLQLEIARAFRDQTFYFPHNIDFRGRAYPVPPYLNHMGADHVRGLLRFAKAKSLGEDGLRWLKIHLANVFGFDKFSLVEREKFAQDNLESILDSARNPLDGKRWWLEAEDPWQCLAACIEFAEALKLPDPTKFESVLPVHQDGTCNGLQHYAALGGDVWGAQQVNLVPGEKPADVYSAVADLVRESIAQDLKGGHPFAPVLHDKITRKVVKQTVMTNVYGVTIMGAKKQVLRQLDSLHPRLAEESGHQTVHLAAYIAAKIFKALSTMFGGAHEIQHWLGETGSRVCRAVMPEQLAKLIAAEDLASQNAVLPKGRRGRPKSAKKESATEILQQFQSTLIWTTPLRMPVIQPYRTTSVRKIKTCLQDLAVSAPNSSDPVNRRKQLQGFPPNFIHSLDASHMLLSAIECDKLGHTFAAVHDSFWTHASDVDSMNTVIRDTFIRIHSDDIIGRLRAEFRARYKGSVYLAKIKRSSASGKAIVEHRNAHKLSLREELIMEGRRQMLLASSNPDEVELGKNMVTPATVYHELSTEDDLIEEGEPQSLDASSKLDEDVEDDLDKASDGEISEESIDADTEGFTPPKSREYDSWEFFKPTKSTFFARTFDAKAAIKHNNDIEVWLPLTFPDPPKKGNFDVRNLKKSKYFFS